MIEITINQTMNIHQLQPVDDETEGDKEHQQQQQKALCRRHDHHTRCLPAVSIYLTSSTCSRIAKA